MKAINLEMAVRAANVPRARLRPEQRRRLAQLLPELSDTDAEVLRMAGMRRALDLSEQVPVHHHLAEIARQYRQELPGGQDGPDFSAAKRAKLAATVGCGY